MAKYAMNKFHIIGVFKTSLKGALLLEGFSFLPDKALSFLFLRQLKSIVNYQDIGINHLFIHQLMDDLNSFVSEVFNPLQSDKDGALDLEQTLLAYMENDRQATQTAKLLHIHVNTLYQRLKRIEEKLQISFSNPEDILKIQLACYLRNSIVSLT
jgi:DNA-binding PucR family transcriptional regulator